MNYKNTIFFVLVLLCSSSLVAQIENPDTLLFKDRLKPMSEDNIFKTDGYFNWGASIIKGDDGKYHLFYARWEKKLSFSAWLTDSEVAHAISDHPAGPWNYVETALTGRGGEHWDAITAHNPKIKFFDGKYYLYYISTHLDDEMSDLHRSEQKRLGFTSANRTMLRTNQRTGVAVSESLNGPWLRQDKPLIEPSGPIVNLTVNPAITKGKDGRFYLIVKGDKPGEDNFIRDQAMAISDNPAGPFEVQPAPVIDYMDTEDMSLWYDEKRDYFYAVFHAHSFVGMVSSRDGIHWKKATEFALQNKKLKLSDGSLLEPDRMERPFVYCEGGEPKVLSMAVKKGNDSFTVFVPVDSKKRVLPNERQIAWQEAELGAVFHYDLHVFDQKKYGQGGNRINPVSDYQMFNPVDLNTDQWVKAIKDAGFTFAIFTATHETGFAMYQSDVNPYSMKALKFQDGKGDLVRDFVKSCHKYGIKPGIYIGIRWNSFYGVHNFQVNGEGDFRDNRQVYYNQMIEGMVEELCTNYGELFEIWFDGGADHPDNGVPDVLPIIQQYQPNCLFYHNSQLAEARWGGSESGTVPYPCWATFPNHYSHASDTPEEQMFFLKHGDSHGDYWMPAMSDAPLRGYNGRHEWFWEPGDEEHIFPVENLMNMYVKSVGRNSTLIMGLTPDPSGLLPEPDVLRLKEWGDEINKRFGTPIELWEKEGSHRHVTIDLTDKQTISSIILQEEIRYGERIRKYEIDARIDGRWRMIAEGSCIGHKRIQELDPVVCSKVRVRILESDGASFLKRIAVY